MKRCLALCILAFAIGWLSGAGLSYYRAVATTPDPAPIPYSVWKQIAAEAESYARQITGRRRAAPSRRYSID
jgi:hypothetical protein